MTPRAIITAVLGEDFRADRARVGPHAWREPSFWALAVYRFGRRSLAGRAGPLRSAKVRLAWALQALVELVTGVSLPLGARVGPGLRIHHFGGIVIHNDAVVGANCTLRHGVTIGEREHAGPVPVIEDDVDIGAYAQVLGGLRVGRGARVGAMSVVLSDVPPGATAVGIPARVVAR